MQIKLLSIASLAFLVAAASAAPPNADASDNTPAPIPDTAATNGTVTTGTDGVADGATNGADGSVNGATGADNAVDGAAKDATAGVEGAAGDAVDSAVDPAA